MLYVLTIGFLTINAADQLGKEGDLCCNNLFPSINNNPTEVATMHCKGVPYKTNCYICARYWSAYLEIPNINPIELCDFLPYSNDPPLPDVPVPSNFNVYVTDENNPEIVWTPYYVHKYRIERKIGNGYWTIAATITNLLIEFYIDYGVTIPDPKGRTIYYRMRGKVYDTYSDYTDEKIPVANVERLLPKKLVDDNTNTEPLPQKFELLANYPNPFNSNTAIRFQLPYETYVTLKIFNVRGEDIRTLTRGRMKPGMQQVEWDGTDQADRRVASGIYIYQIIAGEFRQAQKMTLAY